MKNKKIFNRVICPEHHIRCKHARYKLTAAFLVSVVLLTACQKEEARDILDPPAEISSIKEETIIDSKVEQSQPDHQETIQVMDWSDYFEGLNGGAVIYIPDDNKYMMYHEEVCNDRRSPCSTFKIISSLCGIENGVIKAEDSVRKWSGELFWNADWNRDIDFKEAFRTSCIWYFREVINELGQTAIQRELDELKYGNSDCSDWEGLLNNNNHNPALNGFWVESSLKISPKEQTEVLERIFGDSSKYREDTLNLLKDAMLLQDDDSSDKKVYGKTGLGMSHGIVVDAWFTGYTEYDNRKLYFCVYLGETDNREVSSKTAKKIALELLNNIS